LGSHADARTARALDLRFSRIDYLPKRDQSEPQRFRYATRIGFGFEVSGEGESVGQRNLADGSSTSALTFGSDELLTVVSAADASCPAALLAGRNEGYEA
jgi:hypothetical protein